MVYGFYTRGHSNQPVARVLNIHRGYNVMFDKPNAYDLDSIRRAELYREAEKIRLAHLAQPPASRAGLLRRLAGRIGVLLA
jgi:hypothetical protein